MYLLQRSHITGRWVYCTCTIIAIFSARFDLSKKNRKICGFIPVIQEYFPPRMELLRILELFD